MGDQEPEALVGTPTGAPERDGLSPFGQPMDRATLRRQVALDMALERHKGRPSDDDAILETARSYETFLKGEA